MPSARTNSRSGGTAGAHGWWPAPWPWWSRVAGIVGWRQYDAAQRAAASAAYSAALGQDRDRTLPRARADLEKQATDAREPYRSLAA